VYLKAVNTDSYWTRGINGPLAIPIAHNEGRYIADEDVLNRLEAENRVAFVYCDAGGSPVDAPNGSSRGIAGILNEAGNVLGMMPHPERASSELLQNTGGRVILERLAG
jgi:phosphoribosylformylglycinamidine synthase